ncbi:DUF6056 family protein [Dysgonomonas sp. OttesenSCG-928-M03]|nr:DUF6056 family protein [Dysgonomonas sp. OttesenSCG-928-M03]
MLKFSTETENRLKILITLVILLVVFCLMYALNIIYPIVGEDWDYSSIWTMNGPTSERIRNMSDIFTSQYNHYITWGGRTIVHIIAQSLLFLGSGWHDILNSLAFVVFTYIIYRISVSGSKSNPLALILIFLSLWFCLPNFMANTVWITFSSVYLWGTTIILLFIYPFYKYYMTGGKEKPAWLMSFVFFPAGVIAGWTNENTSLALIAFLCMLFLLLRYNKRTIPVWMWFGLAGVVIGCIVMLLAPGNFVRAAIPLFTTSKEYPEYIFRIWRVIRAYIYYLLLLDIIYFSIYFYIIKKKITDVNNKIKHISLLFFISAHIALIVMVASPEFFPRVMFGAVTFMIAAIFILFSFVYNTKTSVWRNIGLVTCVILTLCFSFDYSENYQYSVYFKDFWNKREVHLVEQKKQGIENIVFNDTLYHHRGFIRHGLYDDFIIHDFKKFETGWPNVTYSKYHHVNSVKLE